MKRYALTTSSLVAALCLALPTCKNTGTAPDRHVPGPLSPLDPGGAVGVWRLSGIDTYQQDELASSVTIPDTAVEQSYLEITDSLLFIMHAIHERVDCTEDYPWQPMTCDTLQPCRAVTDLTDRKDMFSSADTFIVMELRVFSCQSEKVIRRIMERYPGPFPPPGYPDTCVVGASGVNR